MRHSPTIGLMSSAMSFSVILVGCNPAPPSAAHQFIAQSGGFNPVYVVTTTGLEAPEVTSRGIYRPGIWLESPLLPDRVAAFNVTVTAESPDRVSIQLRDAESETLDPLLDVDKPSLGSVALDDPNIISPEIAALLGSGTGVYWRSDRPGTLLRGQAQFSVLIPESSLLASTKFRIFTGDPAESAPIGAAEFDLAPDFFYLAVVGDSIQWGVGLPDRDKISTRVAAEIEARLNRKVVRQFLAVSGAKLVPGEIDGPCEDDCTGEVPKVVTSISLQADLIERPELMDLVIADGCINDLGVPNILNPLTTEETISEQSEMFCDVEMLNVLRKIRARAPQAPIVVTGYYQIVSPQTDPFGLDLWLESMGNDSSLAAEALISKLTSNSIAFNADSLAGLARAVATINEEAGQTVASLAHLTLADDNSVFAPDSLLWGTTGSLAIDDDSNETLAIRIEDPVAGFRAEACKASGSLINSLLCLYVTLGHPNPMGAEALANSIVASLETLEVLPDDEAP